MSTRFRQYLDNHQIAYEELSHAETFTAPETAAALHVPGKEMAKTVIVKSRGRYCMAVLPAHERVDFTKIARMLNVDAVCLATEDEMKTLFPDCEVGAMPPFGTLYGMEEYVDEALLEDREIVCPAGNHHEAVRMALRDFMKLTKPAVADIHIGKAATA